MKKDWKSIEGYEGKYEISDHGDIKSFGRKKPMLIKWQIHRTGYPVVMLTKDKKAKQKFVHRLVALHFVKNNDLDKFKEVHHIDHNKENPHYTNLEWTDRSGNIKAYVDHVEVYEPRGGAVKNMKKVLRVKTGEVFDSISEAARRVDGDQQSIADCCHGRNKTASKEKWEFIQEKDMNTETETPTEIEEELPEEKVDIQKPLEAKSKPVTIPNSQKRKDVTANEAGILKGQTLEEQYRLATAYCRSGMLPKSYNTPEKVLTGLQYAYELGLKPLSALKNIAVINGQPALWGELPLAIVRNSNKLAFIREYFIDTDYKEICLKNKNLNAKLYAAVCEIQREGHERKEYVFTREMANKQGGGVQAIWQQYEQIMFKRKARALALKDEFGDILEGLNIAEYDYNIMPEAGKSYNVNHDGQPNQTSKTENFANKFSEEDTIEAVATETTESCSNSEKEAKTV